MTEVEIVSGICGFRTVVRSEAQKGYHANLQVESDCQNVKQMAENIKQVNVMTELFKKGESEVLSASRQYLPHVTCPVAVGILKALEVSAGLALPKDVTITFRR